MLKLAIGIAIGAGATTLFPEQTQHVVNVGLDAVNSLAEWVYVETQTGIVK